MNEITDHHRKVSRRTGLAYLGIIFTGVFAEFVVRGSLVVDADPVATAQNIAEAPGLFRVGIGADLLMIALDVTVALGLFRLLRHVDRRLAQITTALRLLQGGVIAVNLLNLFRALDLAQQAVGTDSVVLRTAVETLDAVERHALGYDVGLIAFALSCIVLSRLLLASGVVTRVLAHGMFATGAVYLVGSLAAVFAPAASPAIAPLYVIPLVVEFALAVRLVRGVGPVVATTSRPVAIPA